MQTIGTMTIGQRIRAIRTLSGMTQKQLGEKLGCSSSISVSQWETGKRVPNIESLRKLAAALGCKMADLLNMDTGDEPVPFE